jgi:hypothetical protein
MDFFSFFLINKGLTDVGRGLGSPKPLCTWREVHLGSNRTCMDSNPQLQTRKVMISSCFDY